MSQSKLVSGEGGWIKLFRRFSEWEWYRDSKMVHLFIHCLLMANHEDRKYKGKLVKKGTFLTGLKLLSEETGLSVRSVRTALSKLKSTNELTIISSPQGSHIQIVNYEQYQQVPSKTTNERQTSDKRATTNKNYKNYKEEIGARKNSFKKTLVPFKEKYTTDLLKEFYEYWTELHKNGTKMRFEAENYWDLSRRLSSWKRRNDKDFTKDESQVKQHSFTYDPNL